MAKINLLPWRAERRKQRQREFSVTLGISAIVGVLLSGLIWLHYSSEIEGQNQRNAFLQGEIGKVETQITEIDKLDKQKERLLARKRVIEELQANRSQMVHLFDSLVRTIPDGVMLTSLKQEGDILTLQGRSQSNARVSNYMRNLESSGWMTNPDLSIIEAKGESKDGKAVVSGNTALPYVFTLQVKLVSSSTAEGVAPTNPDAADPAAPAGHVKEEPIQPEAPAPASSAPPAQPTQGSPAS